MNTFPQEEIGRKKSTREIRGAEAPGVSMNVVYSVLVAGRFFYELIE